MRCLTAVFFAFLALPSRYKRIAVVCATFGHCCNIEILTIVHLQVEFLKSKRKCAKNMPIDSISHAEHDSGMEIAPSLFFLKMRFRAHLGVQTSSSICSKSKIGRA